MPRTKKTVESAETVTKTAEISEAMEETKKERKTKTKGDSKQPYHKGYHVTYWFIQPLLGSAPSDPDLYKRFIASNAPDAPTREEELTSNTVEALMR